MKKLMVIVALMLAFGGGFVVGTKDEGKQDEKVCLTIWSESTNAAGECAEWK